uniref:Cytochrome P450, E-class, group I n=1 Tax=Saccharum hybrid cultivar R570 TaxID=131158 RepID=A0A059Q2Z8_9POAL|nr:Cytochrome P450, E-class, group I [Saccharum hybrid cultivar R570]AGT16711.1 hypothetical protein SHCRBa_030_E01_F_60 [Saccharum hybrid cultivar R570]
MSAGYFKNKHSLGARSVPVHAGSCYASSQGPLWFLVVPLMLELLPFICRRLHHRPNAGDDDRKRSKPLLPSPPGRLPVIGHLHLIGDLPHVSLRDLATKHDHGGGLMLLQLGTVPILVVSSPHAAQAVLRTHDHVFASRPAPKVLHNFLYGSSTIAFGPYGEHWRKVRKLVTTRLFTVKKVRQVMAKLKKAMATGMAVEMSETMNTFANEIMCRVLSGKFFKEDSRNKTFRELIEMNVALYAGFSLENYFPGLVNSLGIFTRMVSRKADETHERWDDVLENIISDHERRAEQEESADFVDLMLSVQQEYDLFDAGTGTSYLTLELAMAELMRHPHIMTKLQAEVRNKIPNGQEMVREEDLASMAYLRAVVKETLRLHPPAPLFLPYQSMVDCEIDGYTIPSGTRVIINSWAVCRHVESWEKAEEFMPERFMDGGSAAAVDFKGNDFQFIPFGAGRRMCPGINFGLAIVEIMLANLIVLF